MSRPKDSLLHAELLALDGEARSAEIRMPERSSFFAGHFPDQPILPAIGQLQIALDLLPSWLPGHLVQIDQLASLRFQRPLGPGDTFQIQLGEPSAEGRTSLMIRKGGAIVSRGAVLLGAPAHAATDAIPPSTAATSETSETSETNETNETNEANEANEANEELPLPHDGAARWVTRAPKRDSDHLVAEIQVPPASAFCRGGKVAGITSIEAAAQAAALLEALQRADQATDGQADAHAGYLVGATGVLLHRPDFPAGASLTVEIQLAGQAGPLAKYDFQLSLGSDTHRTKERIASGQVSTFIAVPEPT